MHTVFEGLRQAAPKASAPAEQKTTHGSSNRSMRIPEAYRDGIQCGCEECI